MGAHEFEWWESDQKKIIFKPSKLWYKCGIIYQYKKYFY